MRIKTILYYTVFIIFGGIVGLIVVGGYGNIFNTQTFLNGRLIETLTREEIKQAVTHSPVLATVTTLNIFGVGIILNGNYTLVVMLMCVLLFLVFGYYAKKIVTKTKPKPKP